jgi:hypothetical protein
MGEKTKKAFFNYLPVYGSIATGLSYAGVGTIAMLSFLKVRDGGADESSMLAILNEVFVGKVLLWIIMIGTACYMVWRIFEAVTDPYGYGKNFSGLTKRSGIALSTVADLLIVYAAVEVILGVGDIQQNGQPRAEREFARNLLAESWGAAALTAIGIVVLVAAMVQFVYGVTRGYKERLDIDDYSKAAKAVINSLALAGYCSRGIIVGITGYFLLKAAFTGESRYVVNTDKAFDFVGDEVGHVYFIMLALGTVCYGIFMIIQGIVYDQDKD